MWETIKKIDGFELSNKYEVNEFGNIRNKNTHHHYKLQDNGNGYLSVSMKLKDGKNRVFYIHRIVANVFLDTTGIDTAKFVVNHKDFKHGNNHYSNLNFCTQKENIGYSIDAGRVHNKGEDNVTSRLKESQVRLICKTLESNGDIKYSKLLKIAGLEPSGRNKDLVTKIRQRHIWKHISSEYNFTVTKRESMNTYSYLKDEVTELLKNNYSTRQIATILNLNLPNCNERQKFWNFVRRLKHKINNSTQLEPLCSTTIENKVYVTLK